MDGSNAGVIVPGRNASIGTVAIDFTHSRLYWTGGMPFAIQSSDLVGGDIQTIAEFAPVDHRWANKFSSCSPHEDLADFPAPRPHGPHTLFIFSSSYLSS